MRKISYRFVYNRKKSLNDRGTALVQVEAYLNKKKVYFSTHVYLRPEQWDVKRKIIKDHPNQDALNGMLNEFIIELEKKELSLWRQGKTITLSLIKEEFKSNTDASFLGFARKEIMSSQLKDSTKRNHLTTISLLQSFKPTIEFEDQLFSVMSCWRQYLDSKPWLWIELKNNVERCNNTVSDMFGTSEINQARALCDLLNERFTDNDFSGFEVLDLFKE